MRYYFIILFLAISITAHVQTLGGNTVYNFIKLPSSPILTAAGGVNVSYRTNEIGFAVNNPALLFAGLNNQVNASFNNIPGDIKGYSLSGAKHLVKNNATVAAHVFFIDYGSIPQTDAAGNESGQFRPADFVVQTSASKKYLENWHYGLSLKFINSTYQQYRSSALAVDVGVLYFDSLNHFSASFVAKNMGVQLKTYAGEKEDLPFDLQIGLRKRLAKAPLAFSITASQLHNLDITYNDTTFNADNNLAPSDNQFNKIFNHFVLASHLYIGNHLEGTIGYNHLRANELSIGTGNGLTGFSAGIRLKFQKLQVLLARSAYQKNVSYTQLGVTVHLDQLSGISL
ncbi:MAG TPA: type IX secretion system protein PorQ [Flavisolibacter sp.]|nr:type IX secretion system protein PorQ [Flavisolibacter sp.]